MERRGFEAQYAATKKAVDRAKREAKDLAQHESLAERDRLRLTRVLQLVERYQPQRVPETLEAQGKWRGILSSLYRLLPGTREKRLEERSLPKATSPEAVSARSYLLSEQLVVVLRSLRHLDKVLAKEMEFFSEEVLDQKRPDETRLEEEVDTSLTLDYERKNWGVERICLDGVQNHLPTDSKGEKVWVRCLVDGQWVGLDVARLNVAKIKAVRFIDAGVGFDVITLSLLYSTKADEPESRGQFGEGMKMMVAAALREGLDPELESQDWRARPFAKKVSLQNTRSGRKQTVQQLAYNVQYLEGHPMFGSRTTFWKPTEGFVNEVLQMETKVLALCGNYHPLFVGQGAQIVDREPGNIFVKGIFIRHERALLSYNLDDVETNRDRNTIVNVSVENRISKLLSELSDKRVVKTLLKKAQLDPEAVESNACYVDPAHKSVWVEAFTEAFGDDAVLDTGFSPPNVYRAQKLNKIKFVSGMTQTLLRAGVSTEKDIMPDYFSEVLSTSLTLDYGKEIWDEERLLLDAVQNHLPRDSGGRYLGLRFKTRDGSWHDYADISRTKDEEIVVLKMFDDGKGYDHRLLGLFHSTKGGEGEAAGKFGEGLKMVTLAALRAGVEANFYSRNWKAEPRLVRQEIDGRVVEQLAFDVTHALKKNTMDEDPGYDQRSATVFHNPSAKLLKEFRLLSKKVLAIDRPAAIERTNVGDILSLDGGLIYVRDLLIPGDHRTLFSYHFQPYEMKVRDRNAIPHAELAQMIAGVLSATEKPDVIRTFLHRAVSVVRTSGSRLPLEFITAFRPSNGGVWKKVFIELFGENTSIRSERSQDFDAFQQNMHVGLELVTLPDAVAASLEGIGLSSYRERIQEMTDVKFIPLEELSPAERAVVDFLPSLDQFLPEDRPSSIRVYDKKDYKQEVADGFSDGTYINLYRPVLDIILRAADVYFHEKAHHNTGSADAAAGFRNYLTLALAKVALENLRSVRPDLASN